MRVTVLYENGTSAPGLCVGHGLSVHVTANGHSILFDFGRDENYARNAAALGIDIAQADFAVLSHGHYDHGGGLAHFLAYNPKASVYVGPGAFDRHWHAGADGLRDIGLLEPGAGRSRLVVNPGYAHPAEGVELFCLPPHTPRVCMTRLGRWFLAGAGEVPGPDGFAHEQSMVVNEGGRRLLVSGCSHGGIINIIEEAEKLCCAPMDVVLGGFHLCEPGTGAPEPDALLAEVAHHLQKRPARYYSLHCTGAAAFEKLKADLGARLQPLHAGDAFEL